MMHVLLAAEGGYQDFHLGGGEWLILIGSALTALLAVAVGFFLMRKVLAEDQGTPKMQEIAKAIQEGAMAYLKRQFKTIGVILVPLAVVVFLTSTAVKHADGHVALDVRAVGRLPHRRVRARVLLVGPHGIHRDEPRRTRQRAYRGGRTERLDAEGARGRVPHRRCRRHVHRRARALRCNDDHHDLPEHELGDPDRVRIRRLAARAVPASRRRHLHQGGRRGRRPRRQGRSRHPRGRPA